MQNIIDNEEAPLECSHPVSKNMSSVIGGVNASANGSNKTNSEMIKAWEFLVYRYKGAPTTVPIYSVYVPKIQTNWISLSYYEKLMSSHWPLDKILRILSMGVLRLASHKKIVRDSIPIMSHLTN